MTRRPACATTSVTAVTAVIAIIAVLACAGRAAAQPSAGTVFVTGSALAVIEQLPTTSSSGYDSNEDDGGTVAGGALSLGVHLTPRVSARAEWSASATREHEQRSGPIGLPYLTALTGPNLTVPEVTVPALPVIDQRLSTSRQAHALFSLLGYHLPAGRVTFEVLAGLGFVRQTTTSSYEYTYGPLSGLVIPPVRSETRFATWGTAAVAGLDVTAPLWRGAALVAGVRTYELGGALSVRPGLGLRWTF